MPESMRFVLKHDLESLTAAPNLAWRTDFGRDSRPRGFDLIMPGHRWIAFAYRNSDSDKSRCSLVTGFYRCISAAAFGPLPAPAREIGSRVSEGWQIVGVADGPPLSSPVKIPSVEAVLGRRTFRGQTFIPISETEYERFRSYVFDASPNSPPP